MAPSRRRVLAAVAAATSLAGCVGDPTPTAAPPADADTPTMEQDTDTPTATDGDTSTPTETDSAPAVRVSDHPEHGEILVDSEGMTLYMFDSDTQGTAESTCYDNCAEAWPPLTVDGEPAAGDGVTAELATFERDDGEMQVAAGGWPLYYYAPDEEPGDATGQGVSDVWWVLRPDGTPVRPDEGTETPTATPTDTESGGGIDY